MKRRDLLLGLIPKGALITTGLGMTRLTDTIVSDALAADLAGSVPIETLAELRANTLPHRVIDLLGYHAADGVGAGKFFRRVGDTTSIENGGTIFVDAAGHRWQRLLFDQAITAEMFGATGDGSTDDHAAIQAAIDAVAARGGGILRFDGKTYLVGSTVTLKTAVYLVGQGYEATCLKLADGADCDVIKSENFDGLTGSGLWLVSQGVPHALGLLGLRIDGNKTHQQAGDGVKLFAKRIYADVLIHDVKGIGWCSEAGDVAGQRGWEDLPESEIRARVRACGSHGFQFRGPHDARITFLTVNECGGDGLLIERSPSVHSGACDIAFAHIYANAGRGIVANSSSQFRAAELISENNDQEGMILGGNYCQIDTLQLYKNCKAGGAHQILMTGSKNTISNLQWKDNGSNTGGIAIAGAENIVNGIQGVGGGSTGAAVSVGAVNYNRLQGHVEGYSGGGGVGLVTNDGGQGVGNTIDLSVTDCRTLWNNAATGLRNTYRLRLYAAAGQTLFTGSGPNPRDQNEVWDVMGADAGGRPYYSERRLKSGASFAADAAPGTSTIIDIDHGLIAAPGVDDAQVSLHFTDSGGGTAYGAAVAGASIEAADATKVRIKVIVERPGTAGSRGFVVLKVKL